MSRNIGKDSLAARPLSIADDAAGRATDEERVLLSTDSLHDAGGLPA